MICKKNGILFETVVGSHIWKMNHANSDLDITIGTIVSTNKILRGYHTFRPKHIQTEHSRRDFVIYEVEHIINQLLKGNLNFLVATMSPIVLKTSIYHKKLKKIVRDNIAKNSYHSIHGMAKHNYKKFIEREKDTSEHKCNKIIRVIRFGKRLLSTGEFKFLKVSGGTPKIIKKEIKELELVYKRCDLREKPDEKPFRDLLFKIRLDYLIE